VRPIQPVHLDDKGAAVHNLHSALLFLILHLNISDNDLSILKRRLAPEMRDETFGKTTSDLVSIWQDQMKHRLDVPKELRDLLQVNGDVAKPTANALNWLLAKLGALRAVKASSAQPAARQVYRGIPKSVLARLKKGE
jgi:hypothetical protein